MASVQAVLPHWQLDPAAVRERIYRATTPRERERWHALDRLGLVVKRPKKWLLKANTAQRAQFLRDYAQLQREAQASGALIIFVDEAHVYADVDRHGLWVRKGQPALVDSTSPRYGEKVSYYAGCAWKPARWTSGRLSATAVPRRARRSCASYEQRIPRH